MKLIILNGPCGIGKSTVARQLHTDLPLSFLLDGDAQSRYISHYREYDSERREITRAVMMGIIESCLKIKRDVIVDKMTFDPHLLDEYHQLGKTYGADVFEFILWGGKEMVMSRAHARGWPKDNLLTPEKCERFWMEIDQLISHRPVAKIINVEGLDETNVLEMVRQQL